MAQIETWFDQDLKKPVKVHHISGNFFTLDNDGNLIGVNVFDNGNPVTLSGSVSANVVCPDGSTVPVVGTASGNQATVSLPQAAYVNPGMIAVIIKLTSGSTVTTLCAVTAIVYRSATNVTVDPGTIIPDIQALITAIETAQATIVPGYTYLWQKLAPPFSTSENYSVGQFVTYDQELYRFTADHTGTWSEDDVAVVNFGNEIDDFMNEIGTLGNLTTEAKSSLVDAVNEVNGRFLTGIEDAVDDWLDEHPEATTTVQDGSLTEAKFTDALKLSTLKDYVTPEMFGAVCDGEYDDALAINAAIEYAIINGIYDVRLLSRTYTIKTTININDNIAFTGVNSRAWAYGGGTILAADEDITAITVSHSYAKLANFKIAGNSTTAGISYTNRSYGCSTKNVVISDCAIGFDVQSSWSYIFEQCRTEACDKGFSIAEGTNANFISCVAFNSAEYGFYCTKINYSVFSGCGTDGCKYGYYFNGACRGVSLVSCGSEGTTTNGYMVYCGDRTAITIIAFSVGTVSNVQCDVFVMRDGSNTVIMDTNVGSAYYPLGKTLDNTSGSNTVLINCSFSGTKVGLEYCEMFGKTNRMRSTLTVPSIMTFQKTTQILTTNSSEEIAQLDTTSFYLFSAVCTHSSSSRGFGFISIPSTYPEAIIDVSTETASAVATVSSTGMLSITNTSSANKTYKVTLIKIG